MKIVRVTYTTQPGYAVQNAGNIQQVMADLRQIGHPGIFYHVCLGADGVTFTHTAFFEKEEYQKILSLNPDDDNAQSSLKQAIEKAAGDLAALAY